MTDRLLPHRQLLTITTEDGRPIRREHEISDWYVPHMRSIAAATLAVVLTLSACGSDESASPSVAPPASTEQAETVMTETDSAEPESTVDEASEEAEAETTPPTPAVESAAAEPKSATEVADAIAAEIPEISEVLTITEDNDPNAKIGRPGGYIDGAVMFDSRAEPRDDVPGRDKGAFLEVWPDEAAATDRAEFIQEALQGANGVLGSEYHFQHDGYLLRVTGEIKPSDAQVYEDAFNDQFTG